MTPSFGSEGDSGTSLSIPYYFNLAENYDATVEITSLSDRGTLFDNEFRYLGNNSSSLLNFTHLENDDEFGEDRYLYKIDDKRVLYNTLTSGSGDMMDQSSIAKYPTAAFLILTILTILATH